jgi:cytochrome c
MLHLLRTTKTAFVASLTLLLACTAANQTQQTTSTANRSPAAALAPAEKAPEENRFSKVVLVERLDEPMELSVLPDGRVLFIERKGKLKLYDPAAKTTTVVGTLPVYAENEDGLLGMATHPDFTSNGFIFLYYAPAGPEPINRLSRFVFREGQLDLASEKIMLDIPQARACCHSGGSLEFGPDGNLFLSLGDDTNPFESASFNPIDERPGRGEPWDAQRSSGNSNDLRGKILRIRPEPDGSYSIPAGNLFPEGTPRTRPEIYVMGNRNPFRMSVDPKNGFLYWGEVGPDAGADSVGRGPKGHDEVNQARKAGFFGWPYFVGNNKAYWKFDFEKQKSLFQFDPKAPINNSPNNTGIQNLPPAQPAFIWYPYDESEEFPLVGKGGRNAMAGPVYYEDLYAPSEVKFPRYYHGKLFTYDWMRDWIMAVTMDQNHDYAGMERFMPGTVFNKPVDMEFGRDGALYVLEYGTFWNSQNDDARLSRIEFSEGNRKPIVKASVDRKAAAAPATFSFSSEGTFDYDPDDRLSYAWTFDAPGQVQATEPHPSFTFTKPGTYRPTLTIRDAAGKEATAELEVQVGNEPPQVEIKVQGNRSFFWDKTTLQYQVDVTDKEDGSLAKGTISPKAVTATLAYLAQGKDQIQAAQGHQVASSSHEVKGKVLIDGSDCKACHAVDRTSVGPSFLDIAGRYKGAAGAVDKLALTIINGGGGQWGDRQMSAHPQLSKEDAAEMVTYILALAEPAQSQPVEAVPLKGKLPLTQHAGKGTEGTYLLTASYQDKGSNQVAPLTGRAQLTLRHPLVLAADADAFKGAAKANNGTSRLIKFTEDRAFVAFQNLDLTGISQLVFSLDPNTTSGKIELRLGSPEGKLLGSTDVLSKENRPANQQGRWFEAKVPLEPISGQHDLFVVFRSQAGVNIWNAFLLNTIYFGTEKSRGTKM